MRKILFPTDYSAASTAALRYAISLAKGAGAELLVLYVEPPSVPPASLESGVDREHASLAAVLSQASTDESPLVYEFRRLSGDPVDDIVRVAADDGVDLVVMATSGRSGLRRLLMGSVAEAVVRGAPCPVLTLKQPVDGEKQAFEVLPDSQELAAAGVETPDFVDPGEELVAAGRMASRMLLEQAIAERATDVHLHPADGQLEVRFRIDGHMTPYCSIPLENGQHLLQQLKIMADLDIADPFRPHEGRVQTEVGLAGYEVRITTAPVVGGETAAIRLLKRNRLIRPLESLGLSEGSLGRMRRMLEHGTSEGVVLITGPANSGKTTTAYSMVHVLDDGRRNIITIEDPPEFHIPRFRQLAASPRHHISMTSGLRTLLRMDPDIVLVGEIRDVEAAEIAMRAASSGKSVFSTLHTRDVASTITALRDLKIDNRSLSGNLTGIISQRLVRRLCEHCRRQVALDQRSARAFKAEGLSPPECVFEAVGCDRCRHTGYHERVGVFEVVCPDREIRKAIETGISEDDLRWQLRESGVPTLASDALGKVADGITSLDEVRHVTWSTLHDDDDA